MNHIDRLFAESQTAHKAIERLEHVHYLDLLAMFEAHKVGNEEMMQRMMDKLLANEHQIADARRVWRKLHERAMAAVHPVQQPNLQLVEELQQAGAI